MIAESGMKIDGMDGDDAEKDGVRIKLRYGKLVLDVPF